MEDIKTSLDNILAKFNDSVTHSAPKKLSFQHLSDSLNDSGTIPKKRRLSRSFEDNSINLSHNNSNVSLNSSAAAVPPSPWETRRLKADLIESKTRVAKFRQELERLNKLKQESETLLESRANELKKQCDFSSNKIQDLEKHMQLLRKREYAAKQETLKAQNELQQQKHSYEEAILKVQKAKHEAEENARLVQNSLANELSEYKRHSDKLELELELSSDELETVKQQLEDFKTKASCYDDLKLHHEKVNQDLEYSNQKIKELEFEIASYNDWKEITKNSQTRLLNLPDMDRELERLRSNNKNLQELLGNKLLLEEQVYDLRSRLEREEGGRTEAVALQVQLNHAQEEIKEWMKVAQDHCQHNMIVSPLALRARIEELLQKDVVMANEKNNKVSEKKCMESDLLDYKQKCDIYSKNIEELNVALKRHKAFKDRIQKKLLLVSKERDCYKQLLENFEKDLTISNPISPDLSAIENQLKTRIEMLEKTLAGYKDMCSSLEKELNGIKASANPDQSIENSNGNISVDSNPSYDNFKKELDNLRIENERLRRRKEELELELEQRCLKGDFNMDKYKVVHLKINPATDAYENADNLIEKLQAEIERLKRKARKLEEENEASQARITNDTTNMTMNFKEMNQLRSELDSATSKLKKMKECYKSASLEFREVVYMLFGYRIDRVGLNTNYKVSSMYAESPDHYLNFRLNESNVLDMLETPYSVTLKSLIETQLVGNKSLPAFLSALTMDLFQRTTITMS